MMTEIQTIDGGQKDAFLRRANIKKDIQIMDIQTTELYSIWQSCALKWTGS